MAGSWPVPAAHGRIRAASRTEFRPDGQFLAVCQEVPIFDGPEFDVRLERPDGRLVRVLFHMGDGGGCSEMLLSRDSRSPAVLTSHVAGITVLDVSWALANPAERNQHWFLLHKD